MSEISDTRPASEETRRKLVTAGFRLFGAEGYAATTTRRIAEQAETNVASIAYHFGGKAGLHEACVRAVVQRVAEALGVPADPGPLTPGRATALLETLLHDFIRFVVASEEARHMVAFMLREMNSSEASVELIFNEFIGPKHREVCKLWAAATGQDAASEEVKLAVFSMLGQAVYFRIGQPFVTRAMGWSDVGPDEARSIAATLSRNLHAALDRSRS